MSGTSKEGSGAIGQGDLVTVDLPSTSSASNVYAVARKLPNECVLNHPWSPDCYIIKPDQELNRVPPALKNAFEKSLDFCFKNLEMLDLNERAELKAFCAYYIVYRHASQKQGRAISCICGKIASEVLRNNLSAAIQLVVQNQGLLDEYNQHWFQQETLKPIYAEKKSPTPNQRTVVFNQAGFVLAQLETTSVRQFGGGLHEHSGEISKIKS